MAGNIAFTLSISVTKDLFKNTRGSKGVACGRCFVARNAVLMLFWWVFVAKYRKSF